MKRRTLLKSLLAGAGAVAANSSVAQAIESGNGASSDFPDYKALVCIYLHGGNDSLSLLVPNEPAAYANYQHLRQHLAYPPEQLLPLNGTNVSMPQACQPLVDLFHNQQLAVVSNVGPLMQPVTKADLLNDPELVIPRVASHNDQQKLWMCAGHTPHINTGWGGRLADVLLQYQYNPMPCAFSMAGDNEFLSGEHTQCFAMNSNRATPAHIDGLQNSDYSLSPAYDFFSFLYDMETNPLGKAAADKMQAALDNTVTLGQILGQIPENSQGYGIQTDNGKQLETQLKMVARLIQAAPQIGHGRQIYFVSMGGFDTHDSQAFLHPQLIGDLAKCMAGFQADLETRGCQQNIVTFTQSEFGRTMSINGDGTDHGWGGHHFVMGEPVNGGQIVGRLPSLEVGSDDEYENMTIPQYSVEQYASQMTRWLGIQGEDELVVFPNGAVFEDVEMGLL